MSLAIVHSRAGQGIEAPPVTVEVHLANGLPGLSIVGLPETAVKESKDRVRGALLNSQFEFPLKRITINLAPADLPKEGGRFDLPIALGILAASGQVPTQALEGYEFAAELALSGELRPFQGVLPLAIQTRRQGRRLVVAQANAREAALVNGLDIHPASHLLEVCAHLQGRQSLPLQAPESPAPTPEQADLADIHGQAHAKRALEIAAAGQHSLLLMGPPGTGKTLLASRLPGILPPMTEQEALEAAAVQSISAQGFRPEHWGRRPFRAPHHTASAVALVGGGSQPRPGEISLAHHGVLFLDELPEFERKVLEVLREPLESGHITISRAARQASFPARFQLIAAMNPCPCGHLGDPEGRCRCTPAQIQRYQARISGPLLDRIDMQLDMPRPPRTALHPGERPKEAEKSARVRARVIQARARQMQRAGKPNALLDNHQLTRHCRLAAGERQLLEQAMDKLRLSMRAYHRILKLARTIADLAGSEHIATPHLTEALGFRRLDRLGHVNQGTPAALIE